MNDEMKVCELKNIRKVFQKGETTCPLEKINISVHKGDLIAVTGPSGTGKSTLLFTMAGLMTPTSGEVILEGENLYCLPPKQMTIHRNQHVGLIFQETILFSSLTVLENVLTAMKLNKGKVTKEDHETAKSVLNKLGLEERMHYLPHELSVGQKRRVLIARALVNSYSLILADEPTNDLDDYWANEVMDMFKQYTKNGGAVLMVTHHAQFVSMCPKKYKLEHGGLTPC